MLLERWQRYWSWLFYGLLLLALVPGGTAGPLLAGWAFDTTGSYATVFGIFLMGNLSALAALEMVRRRG